MNELISEIHEICVQYYASQLVEYLVLNVTQWNAKSLEERVQDLLDAFDSTRSARFRQEHVMAKMSLTKFRKNGQTKWENASCQDIWAEIRAITNALTKGQ